MAVQIKFMAVIVGIIIVLYNFFIDIFQMTNIAFYIF